MAQRKQAPEKYRYRYGIGEWYGNSLAALDREDGVKFARMSLSKARPELPCPFRSTPKKQTLCTKKGGVCSLRLYREDTATHAVSVAPGPKGALVTVCPHRFKERNLIFSWIGETLLSHSDPMVVGEIGFLERMSSDEQDGGDSEAEDVGRIDNVLVHPLREPLLWCALEIQAVYFSGPAMTKEFRAIHAWRTKQLPFPKGIRRPDFRSSGPKRLMPQLQTKVPSLRRWGKKMAVVVDRSFFNALGKMDIVKDVSNCDIAWFVIQYKEDSTGFSLQPDFVQLTTLERAVEGLTGGQPVSLDEFEKRIQEKLEKSYPAS